ncbi:MAG: DUF4398 domain-containing protein [Polyangiaceae bacterium]
MTYSFKLIASVATLATMAGCGSYPIPVQHMADAEGAARSASDVGAGTNPQASLHLKMATEEIAQAKQLMADGDNEKADSVLVRAKADGELALGEAREEQAKAAAQQAMEQIGKLSADHVGSTGSATSTTMTTGATMGSPNSTSTTTTTTGAH